MCPGRWASAQPRLQWAGPACCPPQSRGFPNMVVTTRLCCCLFLLLQAAAMGLRLWLERPRCRPGWRPRSQHWLVSSSWLEWRIGAAPSPRVVVAAQPRHREGVLHRGHEKVAVSRPPGSPGPSAVAAVQGSPRLRHSVQLDPPGSNGELQHSADSIMAEASSLVCVSSPLPACKGQGVVPALLVATATLAALGLWDPPSCRYFWEGRWNGVHRRWVWVSMVMYLQGSPTGHSGYWASPMEARS